jgi:hypothetical protein
MTSPLLTIIMEYAGPVAAGILIGLLFRVYFAGRVQKKMREYQGEIIRSHSRILVLEEINGRLEVRVKELEKGFSKDQLFMN